MSEHKPGALQCACASCFREDPPPPGETLVEATAYAHIQHRNAGNTCPPGAANQAACQGTW